MYKGLMRLNGMKYWALLHSRRDFTQNPLKNHRSFTTPSSLHTPHPSGLFYTEILLTCVRYVLLGVNAEESLNQNAAKDFGSCPTGQASVLSSERNDVILNYLRHWIIEWFSVQKSKSIVGFPECHSIKIKHRLFTIQYIFIILKL